MLKIARPIEPLVNEISSKDLEELSGLKLLAPDRTLLVKTASRESARTVHSLIQGANRIGKGDEDLVLRFETIGLRDLAISFLEKTFSPGTTLVDKVFKAS